VPKKSPDADTHGQEYGAQLGVNGDTKGPQLPRSEVADESL
jgi:hypothetical protein